MQKTLDKHGRWRKVTVAFRVSPEESEDLNMRVRLSGLTKQDYIIKRLSERDIVVQGNTRVFKALRNQMSAILAELRRIENCSEATDDFLNTINLVAETYNGLEEKEKS